MVEIGCILQRFRCIQAVVWRLYHATTLRPSLDDRAAEQIPIKQCSSLSLRHISVS